MNCKNKWGFTLSEVLLATLIIGVVSVLTIPSVIKGVNQKARMSLLKRMTGNLANLVQVELTRQKTTEIENTDIYNDPKAFLEKFDCLTSGNPFAFEYKRYSDLKEAPDIIIPTDSVVGQASVLLKNGVGVGIVNYSENRNTAVIVDVNGDKEPNIVGADYFVFKLEWDDNYEKGIRAGDVSAYENGGDEGAETAAGLRTACNGGNGSACFRLVELSNYDPDYLD